MASSVERQDFGDPLLTAIIVFISSIQGFVLYCSTEGITVNFTQNANGGF